jgi:hypothetical protein
MFPLLYVTSRGMMVGRRNERNEKERSERDRSTKEKKERKKERDRLPCERKLFAAEFRRALHFVMTRLENEPLWVTVARLSDIMLRNFFVVLDV